jgi:hypothetical protein
MKISEVVRDRRGERFLRPGNGRILPGASVASRAFTLIEVMIASGILFLCLFAILGLLANSLRSVRTLQHKSMDAGMAAAQIYVQLTSTNQVYEGRFSGDFGELYPDSSYDYEIQEVETNSLCRIDISVEERGQKMDSKMTLLMYLPNLRKTGVR